MNKIIKHVCNGLKIRTQNLLDLPIKPKYVDFEITEYCNSKCKHCNIWSRKKKGDDMTLAQIEKAFNDPFMRDMEYIVLTGGEPTMRKDLLDIYLTLHKCCPKATLQLSTNGILPKRVLEITRAVLEKGIRFDVGISLDGYGKDHDDMRGIPGNFKSVDYLVDEFKKLKKQYKNFDFCLGMTVSDLTVDKYDSLKKYANEKKVFLEHAWYQQSPYYGNENQEIKLSKIKIKKIVEKMPETPRKELWLKDIQGKPIKFECYALRTFFVLKNNGDVVPCLTYSDVVAGNITKQSFRKIFTSQRAKELKKNVVKKCPGCLNTWGYSWSAASHMTPFMSYYLRHPKVLFQEMKKK